MHTVKLTGGNFKIVTEQNIDKKRGLVGDHFEVPGKYFMTLEYLSQYIYPLQNGDTFNTT